MEALVGVIVGAVLTGSVESIRHWYSDRRTGRRVARLIALEVAQAAAALVAVASNEDHDVSVEDLEDPVVAWREYRRDLTGVFGVTELAELAPIFLLARRVAERLGDARDSEGRNPEAAKRARELALHIESCIDGVPELLEKRALTRRERRSGEHLRDWYEMVDRDLGAAATKLAPAETGE